MAGVCFVCGCTEFEPCSIPYRHAGGVDFVPCGWANQERTLCDNPECLEEALACPACGILVTLHTPIMEAGCLLRTTNPALAIPA